MWLNREDKNSLQELHTTLQTLSGGQTNNNQKLWKMNNLLSAKHIQNTKIRISLGQHESENWSDN